MRAIASREITTPAWSARKRSCCGSLSSKYSGACAAPFRCSSALRCGNRERSVWDMGGKTTTGTFGQVKKRSSSKAPDSHAAQSPIEPAQTPPEGKIRGTRRNSRAVDLFLVQPAHEKQQFLMVLITITGLSCGGYLRDLQDAQQAPPRQHSLLGS